MGTYTDRETVVSFDSPAEGADTFHDTCEKEQQASEQSSFVPSCLQWDPYFHFQDFVDPEDPPVDLGRSPSPPDCNSYNCTDV